MASPPTFSGHETFPLRFAWLAKAVEAVAEDPAAFGDDAAIARFGVGRNMVRAIRHWALATGVVAPGARGEVEPTAFGRAVFGAGGLDPFCEDPTTAWLLHWRLCRDAGRAGLWHVVFGHWTAGPLDPAGLDAFLTDWLRPFGAEPPTASTLKRDLAVLAACYAPPSPRQDPEDAVACPLTALGLLARDGGALALREGPKRGLTPAAFAVAVLDVWDRDHAGAETLDVRAVVDAPGAPGRVCLLPDEQAHDLLVRAEAETGAFRYDDTAGLRQLYRTSDADAHALLAAAYAVPA